VKNKKTNHKMIKIAFSAADLKNKNRSRMQAARTNTREKVITKETLRSSHAFNQRILKVNMSYDCNLYYYNLSNYNI